MSTDEKRDAANRLMDGITDLSDEIILTADEETSDQAHREAKTGVRRKWIMIGVSAAAVLLAGFIAWGIWRGGTGGERKPVTTAEEQGTTAAAAEPDQTEAGTEADTKAVTEAKIEVITESQTEKAPTEVRTEAVTEPQTEASSQTPTEADLSDSARHEVVIKDIPYYGSLEEMEKDADVILRGVRLDQGDTVISREGGYVYGAHTLSQVKITGIYKDSSEKLKEGQEITVLEKEAYDAVMDTIYHIDGYRMMTYGGEYLLFLKRNVRGDGTEFYSSCGTYYGTVSLTEDGRDSETLIREITDPKQVVKIWEEAREKYR